MEHRRMGWTGLAVSELTLGAMTFGNEADAEEAGRIVASYVDAGGFTFDTADGYAGGRSEEILGALLEGRRDQAVISTKVRFATGPGPNDRGYSRRHILDSVHQSLRRLRTDWIDIYLLHCWDPRCELEETLSCLDRLVADGKVRYIGVSNFAAWHVMKGLGISARRGWEPFTVIQPQYSLIGRSTERELLPLAESERLGVFGWSPLGGGLLTGKYPRVDDFADGTRAADSARRGSPTMRNRFTDQNLAIVDTLRQLAEEHGHGPAQIALRWAMRQPGVTSTILGARTDKQVRENLGALGCELPEEAWARLDEVSRPAPEYPMDLITYSSAV